MTDRPPHAPDLTTIVLVIVRGGDTVRHCKCRCRGMRCRWWYDVSEAAWSRYDRPPGQSTGSVDGRS